MKKIIAIIICIIAICVCLTGCGSKAPTFILLEGGGISLSESTDNSSLKELENKLMAVKIEGTDETLFESVKISENKGIFYNSYRFMATTKQQNVERELKLTVSMSGSVAGVKNGIIEGKQVVFPIKDLSQQLDFNAEFEENNTSVIFGIIIVLVIIMAAFFFFMKRGGNNDNY